MDIIRMTGGMGNQMFQYALYLKLRSQGREVKFDDRSEYEGRDARPIFLWAFGIDYPAASKSEIDKITDGSPKFSHRVRRKLFGRRSLEYHEKDCDFDTQILLREPAYLTGYFQSEKYFEGVEGLVRETFTFSDKIWEDLPEGMVSQFMAYERQIKDTMSVSVHMRRGDYLENPGLYGGICTEEYYRKAIEVMQDKENDAVFFLFSNEPEWQKEWVRRTYGEDERFVVVEGGTEETGYLDMFLMSRCRHHIIANSSFSWWGAWLGQDGGKQVYAPSRWLNGRDMRDIYTKDMIKITPEGKL